MLDYKTALALLTHRSGSSSGSSIQSDWSVNDETDPAYVKGRTHYIEVGVEEILPLQEIENTGAEKYSIPYISEDVHDRTLVTVLYNGVEYDMYAGYSQGLEMYLITGLDVPCEINTYDGASYLVPFVQPTVDTITISVYRKNETVHPLDPKFGGMPTLAEDGSDGGKFVKANAAGDGYELTDGYDVIVYENRPSFSASSGGTDCPPLIKAADFDTVKAKLLAGDLPVALYRRDYYKQDDTGEYLSTASYNVIQNSQAAYYDVEEDYIVFDFPSPESISYIATPSGRLILRPNGTVDYS